MEMKQAIEVVEEVQAFLGKYLIKDADFIHALEYIREHKADALPEVLEAYEVVVGGMRSMFGMSVPEAA